MMPSDENGPGLVADRVSGDELRARGQTTLDPGDKMLRARRAELVRMMAALKQLQARVRAGQEGEVQSLRQENEDLRRALAERPQAADLDRLRAEVEQLRRLLEEKDALVQEYAGRMASPPKDCSDLERYEAELNQFRHQLQEDRRRLNEELEQIRVRKEEVDAATREMEMELSRERAELARERTRLERLRDEARAEVERARRDEGVRHRLAPLHRLRDQFLDHQDGVAQG